jgi:hypothetical protein
MGYTKYIKSGSQFELYEYEKQSYARGRPTGYTKNTHLQNLGDSGDRALLERKFSRRKDNARRASMAFRRLVLSNLRTDENPVLCTLTFAENRTDVSECARFFHIFTGRMRKQFGTNFRYIAVPEFQQRGAVHYHALFWGLPVGIEKRERNDRTIAQLWEQGFVDIIATDGSQKLSTYLAKYMIKAIEDIRLLSHKAYFASRNIVRPLTGAGFPMWWVEEEFALHEADLIVYKQFKTDWLGEGRYRLFELGEEF